jgi:uncharacterized membrane protein
LADILKKFTNPKTIALIAIFTALYAVLRVVPTLPMIGSSGNWFSLSDVIAPIYGIVLGPITGGISIVLGTFLGMVMGRPVVFMFLDFLPATVGAVSLGLLMKKKWIYAVVLNVILLAAFLIHPNTSVFVNYSGFLLPFAWLHIVALCVLISPIGRKLTSWVNTNDATKIAVGIAIMFFVGTMMQHLMGNLLYETIMAEPLGFIPVASYPANWALIFPIYPIERLILIIIGTLVGTPLLRVLKNTSLLSEHIL